MNVSLGELSGGARKGYIAAADERSETQAALYVASSGEGAINLWGPNDSLNVDIGASADDPNLGFVGVNDADGYYQAAMGVYDTGEGTLATWGPNGSVNVDISSMSNLPNNGFIGVADDDGVLQAGVYVDVDGDGVVFGDYKAFVVEHPTKADQKIMYVSLEGPEAGIYDRGVVRLENGRAVIRLPEHFVALADPKSITVQLTPASFNSAGVGYQVIDTSQIEVGELNKGTGSYDVSYLVQAKRASAKAIPTVMSKAEFAKRFKPEMAPRRLAGQKQASSRPAPETAARLKK